MCRVWINDEPALRLSEKECEKRGIREDASITQESLAELHLEVLLPMAKKRCLDIMLRADQSRKMVRDKPCGLKIVAHTPNGLNGFCILRVVVFVKKLQNPTAVGFDFGVEKSIDGALLLIGRQIRQALAQILAGSLFLAFLRQEIGQ